MENLKKISQSNKWYHIILLLIFLYMFVLNCFTPYLADDFRYMFSWKTYEKIESLKDIVISMGAHRYFMNGRIVSHFLEQFFLMFPKIFFNLCNAFIFVWLIHSVYQICNYWEKRNTFLLISIAMAYWAFIPAFGQVTLWQIGSLNYLWALAFAMMFLKPYCTVYYHENSNYRIWQKQLWKKIIFLPLAFFFGMYSETTSLIGILMAFGILFASGRQKCHENWYLFLPVFSAVIGFIMLVSTPSEMQNKAEGLFSPYQIFLNVSNLTFILQKHFFLLCLAWVLLMLVAIRQKMSGKKRILSLGFFLGALASNYVLVVASYAAERSLCTTGLFLIIACMILLSELKSAREQFICQMLFCALSVQFAFSFITGSLDIAETYHRSCIREEQVVEQKAEGKQDIYLNIIYCQTKYSPVYDLEDLDMENPNSWQNDPMAKYYGVERIYGVGENPYR